MKNYEEFNEYRIKDSNEKFKKKKKTKTIKPQEVTTKFTDFDRKRQEIENEESRKNLIKMDKFQKIKQVIPKNITMFSDVGGSNYYDRYNGNKFI